MTRFAALLTVVMALAVPARLAFAQEAAAPDFTTGPSYQADVSALDVRVENAPPTEYPSVGHLAPMPYGQAIQAWATARFRPTGASVNTLRVTLREGAIVEQVLPIKRGIGGWFKKEQSVQYDATLTIEVALIDANGTTLAAAQGTSKQSQTLLEGATTADKRAAWAAMVNGTFAALDDGLAGPIRQNLGQYLR
ncbi:MAG: hypothetical protein SFV21_10220 [Rhodospirillaceae bacterium]|nr:hypothetical protein [Rhodospirillaceae bacterium]